MKRNRLNGTVSKLQSLLTIVYVVVLLVGNIIGAKQINFLGYSMTSAIITFPITYILSDVFSEIYGYKYSRETALMAFAFNLASVAIFYITIAMPQGEFWHNQEAYEIILGGSLRITLASLTAFFIGDYANDVIFRGMKKKYPNSLQGFKTRSIVSSIAGQIVDSLVFVPLAFGGLIPLGTLVVSNIVYTALKILYEVLFLPLNQYVVKKVKAYEERVFENAMQKVEAIENE